MNITIKKIALTVLAISVLAASGIALHKKSFETGVSQGKILACRDACNDSFIMIGGDCDCVDPESTIIGGTNAASK